MPQNPKHPHGGGQPSGQHHGSTAEETAALNETLKTFSEKYYEPNQIKERRERIKFRVDVGVAVGVAFNIALTLGLLIAGVLQSYYSGQQVAASQNQLGIMQDTEHRQLRAYIGVAPGEVQDFGVSGKQRVHLTRKNYGLTPAYDVGFSTIGAFVVKTNVPFDINTTNPCTQPSVAGLITMFPSADLPLNINTSGAAATDQDIALVKSGDSQFVYFGDVCYHDAFGERHYTNYCYMYKGISMTSKDADWCLKHNDSN